MTSTRRATAGRRRDAEDLHRGGVMRYVWPFMLPPVLLLVGLLLHWQLGERDPDQSLTAVLLLCCGAYVAVMTWRYALPRGVVIQRHAAGTAATAFVVLDTLLIFGVTRGLLWFTLIAGWSNAAAWAIRRLEVIRGEGDRDSSGKSGILGELGLDLRRKKVIEATPERAQVDVELGDGQTVEDLQKVLGNIGSHAQTIRRGVVATPGEIEGHATVNFTFRDVLKDNLPWPGPEHPGRSLANGFNIGMYQTTHNVRLYLCGDYRRNIAPGHLAIGGAPRTGKGVTGKIMIADAATRVDAWLMLGDTRKGDQFLAPIRDAIGMYKDTPAGVRAQFAMLDRATLERNRALGAAGFESWTPQAALPIDQGGIGMPAIIAWFEEFANVAGDNITKIVNIAEACLSAGIFLVCSAQRWSGDRVPTSFRSSISQTVCFGMNDENSAGMILSDATLKAGPDPYEWKTRYPGRLLVEGNGINESMFPLTGKGYVADNYQIADVIGRFGIMPELDEATLRGFGPGYTGAPAAVTVMSPTSAVAVPKPAGNETPAGAPAPADDEDPPDAPASDDNEKDEELVTTAWDDPEDERDAANVEPRVALGVIDGPDLRPQPEPGEPTLTSAEKDQKFAKLLNSFRERRGGNFSMQELVNGWAETVGEFQANQRPQLTRRLKVLIDADIVRREKRGHFTVLAEVPQTAITEDDENA